MESMRPDPVFDPKSYPDVIDAFAALGEDATVKVWGADWCPDTRQELPEFAAIIQAAGLDDDRLVVHEVDREKQGPEVEEYEVERIPTIVIEREGTEVARFVESESLPAGTYLATRLSETGLDHA